MYNTVIILNMLTCYWFSCNRAAKSSGALKQMKHFSTSIQYIYQVSLLVIGSLVIELLNLVEP